MPHIDKCTYCKQCTFKYNIKLTNDFKKFIGENIGLTFGIRKGVFYARTFRHVINEKSINDMLKSCDNLVQYLRNIGVRCHWYFHLDNSKYQDNKYEHLHAWIVIHCLENKYIRNLSKAEKKIINDYYMDMYDFYKKLKYFPKKPLFNPHEDDIKLDIEFFNNVDNPLEIVIKKASLLGFGDFEFNKHHQIFIFGFEDGNIINCSNKGFLTFF